MKELKFLNLANTDGILNVSGVIHSTAVKATAFSFDNLTYALTLGHGGVYTLLHSKDILKVQSVGSSTELYVFTDLLFRYLVRIAGALKV